MKTILGDGNIVLEAENIQDKLYLLMYANEMEKNGVKNFDLTYSEKHSGGSVSPKDCSYIREDDGQYDLESIGSLEISVYNM